MIAALKNGAVALKAWFLRWQEHWWLLGIFAGAVMVWVGLGVLDRNATLDSIPLLIALPIMSAYVFAAAAVTYLLRRRWRRHLSNEEQSEWWYAVVHSSRPGAIVVYVTDAVFTLCSFLATLYFFSLAL